MHSARHLRDYITLGFLLLFLPQKIYILAGREEDLPLAARSSSPLVANSLDRLSIHGRASFAFAASRQLFAFVPIYASRRYSREKVVVFRKLLLARAFPTARIA